MGTPWSRVITSSMQVVNDIRWEEQLAVNPAQFFRAKSETLKYALPLLNSPPELFSWLMHGLKEPCYASFDWTSTEQSLSGSAPVMTGCIGYELMSCVVRVNDGTEAIPYPDARYDAETGLVTFPKQSEAGTQYELDFYTDGSFEHELSLTQMRLLGLAIAVVWDEHFSADWLNLQPKIKDASFETVNEANYAEKSNRRKLDNRQSFNDELKKYEQLCAYQNLVTRFASRSGHLV